MDRSPGTHLIVLFRDIIALLLEGAHLFIGDDIRAKAACQRLAKKGSKSGRFFGTLHEDLTQLDEKVQRIEDTWRGDQSKGDDAIQSMLTILQVQYLESPDIGSDDDDEEDTDGSDDDHVFDETNHGKGEYRQLRSLYIDSRRAKHHGPENKLSWFIDRTKLDKTSKAMRKSLLEAIKTCHDELAPYAKPTVIDLSHRYDQTIGPTTILDVPLFRNAEDFHKTLRQRWQCSCHGSTHQHCLFSFQNLAAKSDGCACGLAYFKARQNRREGWKKIQYLYLEEEDQPATLTLSRKTRSNKLMLCNELDGCDGGIVHMTSEQWKVRSHPNLPTTSQVTAFSQELPLTPYCELPTNHGILNMTPQRRMMFALYMSYAYLHLSGGCWWPYNRRQSVLLPDEPVTEVSSPLPFFAMSPPDSAASPNTNDKFDWFTTVINKNMPSLVGFAKLLLELFLGRSIGSIAYIDDELNKCSEEPHGKLMHRVIRACLEFKNLPECGTSATVNTIRNNTRLYQHFQDEVVLQLQWLLHVAYEVKVEEVFAAPATVQVAEECKYGLLAETGPRVIGEGFCLHDDDTQTSIDPDLCKTADEYILRLQKCNQSIFPSDVPALRGVKPVKIAIIDTGVDIPSDELISIYDGRLVETRSWLNTRAASGEQLSDAQAVDKDGHGTHGTSVLLEATRYTDIQVYVAQVFSGREQLVTDSNLVDDQTINRIANAITYAVKEWEVDIITMSFGFPEAVPEIHKAIKIAQANEVLMFAAASNCGGNNARTWPASDDRVVCVYAADGDGNKYRKNPSHISDQINLAFLGSSVKGWWPAPWEKGGKAALVRKSGTSTATPVGAAVAALIISTMRRNQEAYVDSERFKARRNEDVRGEYSMHLEALNRAHGITKVFRKMLDKRDDYDYITPWSVITDAQGGDDDMIGIVRRVINALKEKR